MHILSGLVDWLNIILRPIDQLICGYMYIETDDDNDELDRNPNIHYL